MDKILRAVTADGFIKMMAMTARESVQRARDIHALSPTACAALGRSMCAASMLGDAMKEKDASVTLRLNGGGPLGSVIAVADSGGNMRGYVANPSADPPRKPNGKLDVGAAIGTDGMLTVSRDLGFGEPYVGSVALVSGEVAEDMAAYLCESEQTGAACGLGVLVNGENVLQAGGFIVQLMPGAPEELIDVLQANIDAAGSSTQMLAQGGPEEMVARVLSGLEPEILESVPVCYRCRCSRERILAALASVGAEALGEMAAAGEETEVSCQFCDNIYRFSPEEIKALIVEEKE